MSEEKREEMSEEKSEEKSEEMSEGAGASRCPACGTRFVCGMTAGLESCWCASLPPLRALSDAPAGQCYCPACLAQKISAEAAPR